jgi:secreted PhoX family phosphatase
MTAWRGLACRRGAKPEHGLLAMNHEYIDNGMLFIDGTANWSLDKARKGRTRWACRWWK